MFGMVIGIMVVGCYFVGLLIYVFNLVGVLLMSVFLIMFGLFLMLLVFGVMVYVLVIVFVFGVCYFWLIMIGVMV